MYWPSGVRTIVAGTSLILCVSSHRPLPSMEADDSDDVMFNLCTTVPANLTFSCRMYECISLAIGCSRPYRLYYYFCTPRVTPQVTLGRRLAARALELDAAAHGVRKVPPNDEGGGGYGGSGQGARGRTLVHGDLKTWNIFFAKGAHNNGSAVAGNGTEVKLIDWQVSCYTLSTRSNSGLFPYILRRPESIVSFLAP